MMMSNPLASLMGMIRSGGNPQAVLGQLAQSNPQVRQAMQMMHGKSTAELKQMAYNMAKEQGVNINDVLRQLGINNPSASRGTLTWHNTRGAESAYRDGYDRTEQNYGQRMNYPRSEMDEPESRRRRDSRGRFRSEMDGGSGGNMEMHYPGPYYPPPVYEEMNRIGLCHPRWI